MTQKSLQLGNTIIQNTEKKVSGIYVQRDGENYYCIGNVDQMPSFFISLVSGDNHWLFASSKGGVTAGRQEAGFAIFPYTTVDRIHDSSDITGSKSLFIVRKENTNYLWEPFSKRQKGIYKTNENLYKNTTGDKLIYESINLDLQIRFEYSWCFSNRFGIVKKASFENLSSHPIDVEVLDGLQNIMPANVDLGLQTSRSNLVDAYKKGELANGQLGIFSLSANIVDKAEPSESLLATTVWMTGLPIKTRLLNIAGLHDFRMGKALQSQDEALGGRCAYFGHAEIVVAGNEKLNWFTVADVNQRHSQIKETLAFLEKTPTEIHTELLNDVVIGTKKLEKTIGLSDGMQLTNDALASYRHYSNTLFNCMRGGVFTSIYSINTQDFLNFVAHSNHQVFRKNGAFLRQLGETISYSKLIALIEEQEDKDLKRLILEYLPLSYSRRHGDPSRPWNTFHIEIENPDGSDKYHFEGNWRDIFQNWEALGYSFPLYFDGFISKFLNASTIDGYNPYRITRDGIDWEVIEEDDPWSFIGYWGDHQIIYLQKLLEGHHRHFPGKLAAMLNQRNFVYANVPYRLRSFEDIRNDPQSTIDFDYESAGKIQELEEQIGADGKMVHTEDGTILRATLLEKILTSVLAKLYNYIPDAGIWMNTQRPEWNDANNALVGNGVSMVTLYYVRRHLQFLSAIVDQYAGTSFDINRPLYDLLKELHEIYNNLSRQDQITDEARYTYVEALGLAGETYRNAVYQGKKYATRKTSISRIKQFIAVAKVVMEKCIKKNKRTDGLYHSYNLVTFKDHKAPVERLYKMLEGQVAVISSMALNAGEVSEVLDSLKVSNLYRPDQYSYLLYPNRKLPAFLEKNNIHHQGFIQSQLVQRLLSENNFSLVEKSLDGVFHFHPSIKNARELKDTLQQLSQNGYKMEVMLAYDQALEAYEDTFNHRAFTGRSGTFYGYEGLGSIYWHMVSKLLLSLQETIYSDATINEKVFGNLIAHYYEIRAGIGINKSPDIYGAFPTDPYSHTPANQGVKQPGMTGQVKEDILNRWAELGVQIHEGRLHFASKLLRKSEFLEENREMQVVQQDGSLEQLPLQKGELGFSYCGTPVIYTLSQENWVEITAEGTVQKFVNQDWLNDEISSSIFNRTGKISLIKIGLNRNMLL